VSTTSGAISVPVHEPSVPITATTSGHAPGATDLPPMTGGGAGSAAAAPASIEVNEDRTRIRALRCMPAHTATARPGGVRMISRR
jgi:hypothetical protein